MKAMLLSVQAALVIACLALPRNGAGEPSAGAHVTAGASLRGPGQQDALARAERLYREGSYALAREAYEQAGKGELTPERRAWVDFRLADTRWRSAAQTNDPDTSELDAARERLRELLTAYERPESRDDLFAELHESLGDLSWRERSQDWGTASGHYSAALEWWGRSSDIEKARERYLGIVFGALFSPWRERYWGRGYFPQLFGIEVLANAARIAESVEDRGRAHFLLGRAWIDQAQDHRAAERVETELGAVLELGTASEWYDDALFALAGFHESRGSWVRGEDGNLRPRPDFVQAVALFRRLVDEFDKGETPFWDDARRRIESITAPALTVRVDRFFLPGSEVQYALSWRNLERVDLELVPVDLTRDVRFVSDDSNDWLAAITTGREKPVARWTHETGDDGEHRPGSGELLVEAKPAAGAYLLLARGGGREARALVLVSDASVTVKASGTRLLAWVTDARTGEPLADADVRLWESWYDGGWHRRDASAQADADGIAEFELSGRSGNGNWFVASRSEARQSFAQGWRPGRRAEARDWRVYAYTDRGAYRPGDLVSWKLWARTRFDEGYGTPAGKDLTVELRDPQGAVVREETLALNAFGAAWSTLETTAAMTLGEYRARFFLDKGKNQFVGEAVLFRLEEYKLPEYEVVVRTPRDDAGRPRLFRLGDRVEVEVEATYYYGAPVAGADVEVFVHQRPRWRPLARPRAYPWLYDETSPRQWWGGPGDQVLHETRKSGPDGKVTLAFDTPVDGRGEMEFTVQARVVDASRREITGTGSVVVAEQGYRVELDVSHTIHLPGTRVEVEVRATDPNGNPVADEGTLVATREQWVEVWRDPAGREVFGGELERLRSVPGFPAPGWTQVRGAYEREEVARGTVRTGENGEAVFSFTPPREGNYRVAWTSTDDRDVPITAETRVFVADENTRTLGYLPGGVELLVDRDTLRVGQEAVVLLATPASGRWVLFTVEGEDLRSHRVLHLDGQVKMVRVPITDEHVPNLWLGAVSIWDGNAWMDSERLVVPPVEQFLDVSVESDAGEYEPGAEGELVVRVTDHAGKPVETTLSLALVDEAVDYVQAGYAIDPRQFFYGDTRPLLVQTGGSFQQGRYVDLVRRDRQEAQVVERRYAQMDGPAGAGGLAKEELDQLAALGYSGGGDDLYLGERRKAGLVSQMAPASRAVASETAVADSLGLELNRTQQVTVQVRSDFRATALWLPGLTTGADGTARAPMTLPDSTTRWRATARAADAGTRVGEGTTSLRTRLPLIVRLQAPRFFQVGDEVVVSGNLNNNLDVPLTVATALTVEGLELLGRVVDGALSADVAPTLTIPAGGQLRVDWRVAVREVGEARLKLAGLADELGDAVERTLPVFPHGIEAFIDLAGRLDEGAIDLALDLPAARGEGTTALEVTLTPSLAVTMLDALPYLADYPYGCVEQTLSRFLPAVVVAKTLRDFELDPGTAMTRVFGGIERAHVGKTHPDGSKGLERLDEMTRQGLERLYDFQHSDGGWAWWKHGDSDHFMSAYVLWGLALARDAGVDVRDSVVASAARYLALELVEEERRLDLQAWMLHALAIDGGAGRTDDARRFQAAAFDNLWQNRDGLNAYARALLCLSADAMGRESEARTLAQNLRNGAIVDDAPDTSILQVGTAKPFTLPTAHWGNDGVWRRWSEGGVETTAFVLRALVAVDPEDELVTPVMNWLVKNRRGAQWSNTRDTAICVLALNEFLRASGELGSAVEYELSVNGTQVATRRLEKDELLAAPSAFEVDPALLRDGENVVRVTKKAGDGPLYFAARARFFSQEEPIPPRGNEVFVRRDLYRLAARKTLLAGTVYERVPLADGDELTSGERVEVVLTIEAKNDLEYLVFEDLKAAGLEAVQVRSGEPVSAQELKRSEGEARFGGAPGSEERRAATGRDVFVEARVGTGYTGRSRQAHQELRDRKVAFFLSELPQGLWELRYELRAETPGRFHALPTLAHAMYVPEIHANGAELRMDVLDR